MKSKLKNVLLMGLSLVLVAVIAIGATVAYFTDTDSDVNVMTVGNVQVKLQEKQRSEDGSKLVDFVQGKELSPLVGSAQGAKDKWGQPSRDNASNYVDKIVYATNTGKNDAYIRFLVAIPTTLIPDTANSSNNPLHWSWGNRVDITGNSTDNGDAINTQWKEQFKYADVEENGAIASVTIDGEKYWVTYFTMQKPLAPGADSLAVMAGLYLDNRVDYDADLGVYTFNGQNINYDFSQGVKVPVMVQAVQASGFKTAEDAFKNAFGEATVANAESWFGGVEVPAYVSTAAGMEKALANGGEVNLTNNVALTADTTVITKSATVNLSNNVLSSVDRAQNAENTTANEISTLVIGEGADVVLNAEDGGVVNNEFGYGINVAGGTLTVNGGTYTAGGATAIQVISGTLNINGGFFDLTGEKTWDYNYLVNCIDANYKNGTAKIEITGGTFVNWNPANNASEGAGTNYVPEGYGSVAEVQANGDIWYTVVPQVKSADELKEALVNGGLISLGEDITIDDSLVLNTAVNVTLDLNGNTITSASDAIVADNDDAVITITGNGTINAENSVFWAKNGLIKVMNGTFHNKNYECVYTGQSGVKGANGEVEIYGGKFSTDYWYEGSNWLLNENDANRGTITVYGGRFYQFNPANNKSEGAKTNFLAKGYTAVKEESDNGSGNMFTVKPAE